MPVLDTRSAPLSTVERAVVSRALEGKKRPPKPGPYSIPDSLEKTILRGRLRRLRLLRKLVFEMVLPYVQGAKEEAKRERSDSGPARVDAPSDNVQEAIRGLRAVFFQRTADPEAQARAEALEMNEVQLRAMRRQMRPLGVDVLGSEPWLRTFLEASALENASLIKDVEEAYIRGVERASLRAVVEGKTRKALTEEINALGPKSAKRARVQARDQIGKLTGQMHGQRMKELGIPAYRWRTSRDENVVGNPSGKYPVSKSPKHGNHYIREGRSFLLEKSGGALVEIVKGKKVPTSFVDGHPGEGIQCRCWREPVIPELDDLRRQGKAPMAREAEGLIKARKERKPRPAPKSIPKLPPSAEKMAAYARRSRRRVVAEWAPEELLPPSSGPVSKGYRPPEFVGQIPKTASDEEVAQALQWSWVHLPNGHLQTLTRLGAEQEFGTVPGFNPRGLEVSRGNLRKARKALRKGYVGTQEALEGRETVTLYRGFVGDRYVPGSVESWTTSPIEARKVARTMKKAYRLEGPVRVFRQEVPAGRVLLFEGGPGWTNGAFGAQEEWMILNPAGKIPAIEDVSKDRALFRKDGGILVLVPTSRQEANKLRAELGSALYGSIAEALGEEKTEVGQPRPTA